MRKIREVLRLKWALGLSLRQIERSLQLSYGSVHTYWQRAKVEGLSWEQVAELSDDELESRLYPSAEISASKGRPLPDWAEVQKELSKKSVTLSLLWMEYRERHPDGLG